MSETTILLVDDNEELRFASAALLAEAGYCVLEAANAAAALRRLRRGGESIDLVVTDVNMPGESGIRLVERLRLRSPQLPVVLISGHIDQRLASRLAKGDVAFLAKPFGPASLREALAKARRVADRADSAAPIETRRARSRHPARHRPRSSPARPRAARRRFGGPATLALAALLVAALGIAWALSLSEAPELPSEVPSGVVRSLRVEPLFPAGALATVPRTLAWKPTPGADAYRVEIRRIGYDLVWQAKAEDTVAALPETVRAHLDAGVEFTWQVEALIDGRAVARSEIMRFRISARSSGATGSTAIDPVAAGAGDGGA